MSCCGGNCGCGSDCNCGTACAGCKMNADLTYTENPAQTVGLASGVAPHTLFKGAEMGVEAADNGGCGGCKCGSDCKCDPCYCN